MEKRKKVRLLSALYDLQIRRVPSGIQSESSIKSKSLLNSDKLLRKHIKYASIKNSVLSSDQFDEKFIHNQKQKTLLDQALIFQSLKKHFLFNALLADETIVDKFIDNFQSCIVKKGWYLISQNDKANFFFILQSGILAAEVDGQQKGRIYSGDGFGQLALLYSAPRSASIKALKDAVLWYIDRDTFRYFSHNIMKRKYQENLSFINKTSFFNPLSTKQKNKLASTVISLKYDSQTKVFQSGSRASSMFIIKKGKLKKSAGGYSIQIYREGDVLQQFAVLTRNSVHRQTLLALTNSELLSFDSDTIQKVLGKTLPLIVCRNLIKEKLLQLNYFSCLSAQYVQKIIDTFQIRKIEPHEVVVYSGLPMKSLIFSVIQGNFRVSNNNKVSQIYGYEALQKQQRNTSYDFTLDFITFGKIAYTSVEAIQEKLACSFRQLQQINNSHLMAMKSLKKSINKQRQIISKLTYSDFQTQNQIGSGHFGIVYKAKCMINNKIYALKKIKKNQQRKKYIDHEKQILNKIIHPFVMSYYGSFQHNQSIYFVLQHIEGQEMFQAIRKFGILSNKEAQFYSAILLEALYSMHKKNIIYRDLKPENIMLKNCGYLKIIDFGTAKILNQNQRTYTIIGTPSYMAPEVLLGKGYSYEADLWSLGVIIYEFLAGQLPFGEDLDDPYQIFQEVLYKKLQTSKFMKQEDANELINRLLSRQPYERLLGCYSTIRNHPFFQGINWQDLYNKNVKPRYSVSLQISNNFDILQDNVEYFDKQK